MQAVTTIGLDIAKSVFQIHGVDAAGNVIVRRQLKRSRWHGLGRTPRPVIAARRSSISRGKSCLSRAAIGQPQVTQSEDWLRQVVCRRHRN